MGVGKFQAVPDSVILNILVTFTGHNSYDAQNIRKFFLCGSQLSAYLPLKRFTFAHATFDCLSTVDLHAKELVNDVFYLLWRVWGEFLWP